MAKPLTDKKVGLALGWKPIIGGNNNRPLWRRMFLGANGHDYEFLERSPARGSMFCHNDFPPYTTSIDTIVAEVKKQGLTGLTASTGGWEIHTAVSGKLGAGYRAYVDFGHHTGWSNHEPAEALCMALMSYLKEKRRG